MLASPQPVELPAPPAATLRRNHQLFGLARALIWPGVQARITLAAGDEAGAAPGFDTWCEWQMGSWRGHLACHHEDLAKLAAPELQPWLDADTPAELAAFLREAALAPWLASLEAQAGVPVKLTAWSRSAPENLPATILATLEDGGSAHVTVLLAADEAAFNALGETWVKIAPIVEGAAPAGLPLLAIVEAGRKTLPAADWKSLAQGDVVILDAHAPAGEAPCVVRVDGQGFSAKLAGKKIELLAPVATETEASSSPAPGESWVDALPVTIVFEAGRVDLPLKDLRALKPGYCFELAQAPGGSVVLMANGQAVGEGELVRVGEVLGVRVVRMRLP